MVLIWKVFFLFCFVFVLFLFCFCFVFVFVSFCFVELISHLIFFSLNRLQRKRFTKTFRRLLGCESNFPYYQNHHHQW